METIKLYSLTEGRLVTQYGKDFWAFYTGNYITLNKIGKERYLSYDVAFGLLFNMRNPIYKLNFSSYFKCIYDNERY